MGRELKKTMIDWDEMWSDTESNEYILRILRWQYFAYFIHMILEARMANILHKKI